MLDDRVRRVLLRRQALAEGGNVLVVPGVAVRDRRAVPDARNLISVVPPRHDAGIVRSLVAHPPVRLAVVIDDDFLAVLQPGLVHDRGVGHLVRHLVRIPVELPPVPQHRPDGERDQQKPHHLQRDAVVHLEREFHGGLAGGLEPLDTLLDLAEQRVRGLLAFLAAVAVGLLLRRLRILLSHLLAILSVLPRNPACPGRDRGNDDVRLRYCPVAEGADSDACER
mmetsp:Transcript_67568/g.161295  ORF Transcript_67568/g.161295 Transcript_67568/m.161295 type:complete len:224 (+) Transcript_67568:945-1616(+)